MQEFPIRKQKLRELPIEIISDKNFQKKLKINLFVPFWTGMGLDFDKFLSICKSSGKSNMYISDETVHSQTAIQRDDQTDRKRTFHRFTTLQAGPINQADNHYCWKRWFDQNSGSIALSSNF